MLTDLENVRVGFVLIGRNEGARLQAAIKSLEAYSYPTVYVDSGSTDDSVEFAEQHGIHIVHLDTSIPFTAARARNAGWLKLLEQHHEIEFVQFLDGDCMLDSSWLKPAIEFLQQNDSYAIACGQRKELKPQASFYNTLCDLEWNTPVGDADATGGDFLIRTSVLTEVSGFRNDFIAGEEPEMCFRIRQNGHLIRRLDHTMTWHDADIHHFSQWWKRAKRCGYAYALGAYTHTLSSKERYKFKQAARSLFWGLVLPVLALAGTFYSAYLFYFVVGLYCLSFFKNLKNAPKHNLNSSKYALHMVLGKFAEAQGAISFLVNLVSRRKANLIEYK